MQALFKFLVLGDASWMNECHWLKSSRRRRNLFELTQNIYTHSTNTLEHALISLKFKTNWACIYECNIAQSKFSPHWFWDLTKQCMFQDWVPHARPGLDHILIRLGLAPSHASFTARSSCPHLRGNPSSLGTNVTIPGQNYKYSSWHHFHYSRVNRWSSFTCQRRFMA